MAPGADIVILAPEIDTGDPRTEDARTKARVVLHRKTPRVLVEIQSGEDAVGATCWHRIDPGKADATEDESRAAYSLTERLLAEWYERAIAAETRAVAAEARASRAEQRAIAGPRAAPALPESRAAAREKIGKLLDLATNEGANAGEAANAALSAARLIRTHRFDIKP